MENHTAGYRSTEFWLTLLLGLPGVLVAAGIIPTNDQNIVGDAVSKLAGGLIGAVALWKYIHSRMHLKSFVLDNGNSQTARSDKQTLVPLILAGLLLFSTGAAQAQSTRDSLAIGPSPRVIHTSWFRDYTPYLQQIQANQNQQTMLLHQIALYLAQHQAAPAPGQPAAPSDPRLDMILQQLQKPQTPLPAPQVPPPQIIVLGGPPSQQIPLGGPPRQDIPFGGPPKQDIPIGTPPHQDIPLGGPPKQEIPFGNPAPTPSQPAPIVPAPTPTPPSDSPPKQKIPLGYQTYSRTVVLPESSWQPVYR
jgi:hypothetical protein